MTSGFNRKCKCPSVNQHSSALLCSRHATQTLTLGCPTCRPTSVKHEQHIRAYCTCYCNHLLLIELTFINFRHLLTTNRKSIQKLNARLAKRRTKLELPSNQHQLTLSNIATVPEYQHQTSGNNDPADRNHANSKTTTATFTAATTNPTKTTTLHPHPPPPLPPPSRPTLRDKQHRLSLSPNATNANSRKHPTTIKPITA